LEQPIVAAKPITAVFTAGINRRLIDFIESAIDAHTDFEPLLVTEEGDTSDVALESVVLDGISERNKYPGKTERILIEYLQERFEAQRLLYIGIHNTQRMAEINRRVFTIPYSVIVLDSDLTDTSHIPENQIDSIQEFLFGAYRIFVSGKAAKSTLLDLGVDAGSIEYIVIPEPAAIQRESATTDSLRICLFGALGESTRPYIDSLSSLAGIPVTMCLYGNADTRDIQLPAESSTHALSHAPAETFLNASVAIFLKNDATTRNVLPSLEFLLLQLGAASIPVLTDDQDVIDIFERHTAHAPITIFQSPAQLKTKLAGLLENGNARASLAQRQFTALTAAPTAPDNLLEDAGTKPTEETTHPSVQEKARSLLASGDAQSAFELLNRALSQDLDNPGLLIQKAEAALQLGEKTIAELAINRALAIFPDNPRAEEVLEKIRSYTPQKNENTTLQSIPADSGVPNQNPVDTALQYLREDRAPAALELLLRSGTEPTPRDYYHTLALCYAKLRNYKESRQAVRRELDLFPENGAAQALQKSLDALSE
jgi:tetratricopeptide (TPR) repeat protein